MSDPWLSNTYLVADEPGGHAVMIDAGGPVQPLLDYLKRGQLHLTHVLLTHHHHDHVAELDAVKAAYPGRAGADPPARARTRAAAPPGRWRPAR